MWSRTVSWPVEGSWLHGFGAAQRGGEHVYIYWLRTAHPKNFTLENARPWVRSNALAGFQLETMPRSQDNWGTERQTDTHTFLPSESDVKSLSLVKVGFKCCGWGHYYCGGLISTTHENMVSVLGLLRLSHHALHSHQLQAMSTFQGPVHHNGAMMTRHSLEFVFVILKPDHLLC